MSITGAAEKYSQNEDQKLVKLNFKDPQNLAPRSALLVVS
jgi:hypothetical protein